MFGVVILLKFGQCRSRNDDADHPCILINCRLNINGYSPLQPGPHRSEVPYSNN
jgi:hypothetical protein